MHLLYLSYILFLRPVEHMDEKASEQKLVRTHTPSYPACGRAHMLTSHPHADFLGVKIHLVSLVAVLSGIMYTQYLD